MSARFVPLARVSHAIPLSLSCVYKGARVGRLPFLSRVGPEGRRTREWWCDLEMMAAYAQSRGWPDPRPGLPRAFGGTGQ